MLVQVPPLPGEQLYPKEQALVDLVAAERLQGRRVLVYATHTGTRDITGRMEEFLGRHGFRVAVMKADAVPPERREAWVAQRVEEGVDVLVCHPRLVQTGLDLVDFPTICWFETDYSVYTMRQASRRSWRIGQSQPVQVVFMAYRGTLQADALQLVAKKLQSSLAVEGELPEDGLAAYGDDADDLMLALARKIVGGRGGRRDRSSRSSPRRSRSRRMPRRCSSTRAGMRRSRSQRMLSRSARVRTTVATTQARRSGRCARGRNSWPGNRRNRSPDVGMKLPHSRCSSGRSTGSARENWSARSVRPVDTGEATAHLRWPPLARPCVRGFLRLGRKRPTARHSIPGHQLVPWLTSPES